MRVLIVHSKYLSGDASGENRVVEDEALLLARGGHTVHLWQPSPRHVSGLGLLRTATDAIWSSEAVRRLTEAIKSVGPDIIHCHNLFPRLSPAVLRTAAGRGIPVVMTLHNYRLMCLPATFLRDGRICEDCLRRSPWPGVLHACYRGSHLGSSVMGLALAAHRALKTFDHATLFLAVSPFVRDKYIEGGLSADRIFVKSNFAWSSPRREGSGDYFLFLGRLSPEKGLATLFAAWRRVDAELLVVGDGPEGHRLRALAPAGIELRGSVPFAEVPALLRRARALVLPSISYEAQPRVVLEAYAAGVPVLASRIGGLPDTVLDGGSGLLLPPGDVSAWAEAAGQMLNDADAKRLGEGAYRLWEERYSPEEGLAALEDAYANAAQLNGA